MRMTNIFWGSSPVCKIAVHFDRDRDGYIDLSSILRRLRRARSLAKKQPISDSEKIDYEVGLRNTD